MEVGFLIVLVISIISNVYLATRKNTYITTNVPVPEVTVEVPVPDVKIDVHVPEPTAIELPVEVSDGVFEFDYDRLQAIVDSTLGERVPRTQSPVVKQTKEDNVKLVNGVPVRIFPRKAN